MNYYKNILLKKEKNELKVKLKKKSKIKELNSIKIVLEFIIGFLKMSFNIILIGLAFIGLVALINRTSRLLIWDLLLEAYQELKYIF